MAKSLTGKAKHHPPVWNPNIDGGRFCNPVLFMDYSDPDVIRKGSDFFMAASSFFLFSRNSHFALDRFGELVIDQPCV